MSDPTQDHDPDASAPTAFGGTSGILPAVDSDFVPEPFGKYWLIDKIATGGMAHVFRGKAFGVSGFEKVVVIKRILGKYADDPEFVSMFIEEAKLSAQLSHPNIVQVYDFGKVGANYFIAMEAVEGKDLKALLRRETRLGSRLPVQLTTYIASEVARGLQYAHERVDAAGRTLGVVHRDVSPSNILLGYDGHVRIVDFGIAQVESSQSATESGVLKGKYSYMSPEQSRAEVIDSRSDLFSLGILLWELLTGHRLFKKPNELETLDAIQTAPIDPPSRWNPGVPPELDAICLRALQRNPDERYPTASAMQLDLADALPSSADRLRGELSEWMRRRFAREEETERERLDRGAKMAAELHYDGGELDLDFDEPTDEPTPTISPAREAPPVELAPPPKRLSRAWILVVLLAVAVGLILWQPWVTPTTTATLNVAVLPQGLDGVVVTLDGERIPLPYDQVVPGEPHELRVEAPGYEPRTRTVELVVGQNYSAEVQLQALPKPEATPAPTPTPKPRATPRPRTTPKPTPKPEATATPTEVAAAPPTVRFTTEPSGSRVYVDGRKVGNTPLDWTGGRPGRSYNVEFRLDDHRSVQATVTAPEAGGNVSLSRTMDRVEQATPKPGLLNVQVAPGWAKVFVDGAYVSTTPLIGHPLPPGKHSIQVVNERQGIEQTDTVTIESGERTIKAYNFDR